MTEKKRETLSDEDLFRLELLADGELDEDSRRTLLSRLDQTSDGWRRCALAFLEAQCLGESFERGVLFGGPGCSGSETEDVSPVFLSAAAGADRVPVLKPHRPGADVPHGRRRDRSRLFLTMASSACAVILVGLAGWYAGLRYDSGRDLPRAKGEAFFAESPVPDDSADLSRESSVPILVAGKEVTAPMSPPPAEFDNALSRSVGSIPALNGRGISAPPAKTFASASQNSEKLRHITIRRPGGLDEISVPCVEAESYVSDNSAARALAENYRQAGCQVETRHEDLEFRLQDGKTVIVPVDTIDVQRAPQKIIHFL